MTSRHSRHLFSVFGALVALAAGRELGPAEQALAAAETPARDGIAAVNCFYMVRAGVRLLRKALPVTRLPPRTAVRVANDGSWFQLRDGRTITLAHRPTLARILADLVKADSDRSVFDLLQAGWPGETPRGSSGPLRVYTAVARLRRLGLDDALEGDARGYRLNAERA